MCSGQLPRRTVLLKNVNIVDTKSGNLRKNRDILLVDGKIRRIEIAGKLAAHQDMQVIEATGKYVVPGLINMHMHVIDYPYPSENLALMLSNGITGFRQMSGSSELLKLRKVSKVTYAHSLLERDLEYKTGNQAFWGCQVVC